MTSINEKVIFTVMYKPYNTGWYSVLRKAELEAQTGSLLSLCNRDNLTGSKLISFFKQYFVIMRF